jgi:long-subunit fatty acid transport protein
LKILNLFFFQIPLSLNPLNQTQLPMKRSLMTTLAVLLLAGTTFAGGIVTNTNHSAMYTRMGNRAATLGIDAVFFNPAGLTKLENGFHFSLSNQVIGQTRTVTTDYDYVLNFRDPSNSGEFIGEVSAYLFPSIYGVFKTGKWAFSVGFNPIGGGGSATYDAGLPSFEYPVSDIPPALTAQGMPTSAYRLNAFFEGSSVFYGYQANISYEINDMISIALGARYVRAEETYSGHLKDIEVNMDGAGWTPVPTVFSGIATTAAQLEADALAAAGAASSGLAALAAAGGNPGDPLTDPTTIGILTALGQDPTGMTNGVAEATLTGLETAYNDGADQAAAAEGQALATAALTSDQDVDAEKTGSGITPIVSINVQPMEMLNIAVKYEHSTKLELTTAADADKQGLVGFNPDGSEKLLFADGEKTRLDMPAYLTVGATLRPIEPLLVAGFFGTYFDKNVVWGTEDENRVDDLSGNSWELGLAAEYSLSESFLLSAGWSMTSTGATPEYNSDLSYSLGTHGISAGLAWKIIPMLELNVGGQFVIYDEGTNDFEHDFAGTGTMIPISENLQKSVWIFAAGLNISLASGGE